MATPEDQTEDIAWALCDALTAQLPVELAGVQAKRTRHPLELPVPGEIPFGFDENVLQAPPEAYPRVAIVAAPRTPDTTALDGERFAEVIHYVLIEWQVLAPTFMDATLMAWRYGQAIMAVVRKNAPFAKFKPQSIAPQIDGGMAMAIRSRDDASKVVGYISGGTATVAMKGQYSA